YQPFGDCQSKTCALLHTLGGGSRLVKFFENGPLILPSNANAGVTDGNLDPARLRPHVDPGPAALRRELESIAEQVIEDLFETNPVRPHEEIALSSAVNFYVFGHRQRLGCIQNFVERRTPGEIFRMQLNASCLDSGEIQNIVNKAQQVLRSF